MLAIFRNVRPVSIGRNSQTGIFEIDVPRFTRSMDCLARGVYYHHFGKEAVVPRGAISYSILPDISSEHGVRAGEALREWRDFSDAYLADTIKYGDNPAIFYYQVVKNEETYETAIRMAFYEGFVVDVVFSKADTKDDALMFADK